MTIKYKKIYPMYGNWFIQAVRPVRAKIVEWWYEIKWERRPVSEVFESKKEYIEWIKDYMQCLIDMID